MPRRAKRTLLVLLFTSLPAVGGACGADNGEVGAGAPEAGAVDAPSGVDRGVPPEASADAGTPPLRDDVLVLDSNRTGNFELYRMNVDGTAATALTNDPTQASWWGRISPERRRILFYRRPASASEDYAKATLWVMNADGTDAHQLRAVGEDGWLIQAHAEWSPDGASLVMCGTSGATTAVFVTDANGKNPRPVAQGGGWNCDPSWSPDGLTIVFNHCDTLDCPRTAYQIHTVSVNGGASTAITKNAFINYDPYYSHDGTRIAWLVEKNADANPTGPGDAGARLGAWAIARMQADGGGVAAVIDDGQVNSKPAWSLDDATIFFHRLEPAAGLRFRTFRIAPDGTGLAEIAPSAIGSSEYPTN